MFLSHITLLVSDIPRSKAFYQALGLELIVDAAHYCRFRANLDGQGSQTLSISHSPGPIGASCHVGFEFASPEALDFYADLLQSRGFALAEHPQDRSWLWRDVILHDPDGHEILLLYAGDNKLNPPWRVEHLPD
ncbi:MAG: VOC family protein [Aquidulcibacter sp.]|uniref:VOC family protein n=1 Tax=Aquidulcibacter sp. TaxID=2052990 RepID=UPI0022CAAEBB|nr:VOC family protein [Aquidulcibacter sp.]